MRFFRCCVADSSKMNVPKKDGNPMLLQPLWQWGKSALVICQEERKRRCRETAAKLMVVFISCFFSNLHGGAQKNPIRRY